MASAGRSLKTTHRGRNARMPAAVTTNKKLGHRNDTKTPKPSATMETEYDGPVNGFFDQEKEANLESVNK